MRDTFSKIMYALITLIIILFVWLVIIRVPALDNILIAERNECIVNGGEIKQIWRGYVCAKKD